MQDDIKIPSKQDYEKKITEEVIHHDCRTKEDFLTLKEELEKQGFKYKGDVLNDEALYQQQLAEEKDTLPLYLRARQEYGFKTNVDEAIFEYLTMRNKIIITPAFDEEGNLTNSKTFFTKEKEVKIKERPRQDLLEKLKVAEEEIKKYKDLYKRTYAEMENIQKRREKDKEEITKYANESLIKDVLPVIDNIYRALSHAQGDENSGMVEGLELILNSLMSTLKKSGVEEIKAEGEPFDPNYHEAMFMQPDDNVPLNHVLAEFEKGYMLNGRLIRAAKVIVSKGKE